MILTQDRLDAYKEFVAQMTKVLDLRKQERAAAIGVATKASLPSTEDYAVVRAYFVNTLLESFRSYVSESRGRASEIKAKRVLISAVSAAFYSGYRDAGGEDTDDPDEKWLTAMQRDQLGWMDNTFDALKRQRDTESATIPALENRVAAWGSTLDGVYAEGKLRGRANVMLTLGGDDGEESCVDCQRLKGKRHSAQWWIKRDLVRRNGNEHYACGRWSACHHHFYTDSGELYAE